VGVGRFSAARTKLRAASEAAAEALLSAERAKLRSMMEGAGASLDAIEAELQRWAGRGLVWGGRVLKGDAVRRAA
jgi:hypothetical protein